MEDNKSLYDILLETRTLLDLEDAEWNYVWHLMPKDNDEFDHHHEIAANYRKEVINKIDTLLDRCFG